MANKKPKPTTKPFVKGNDASKGKGRPPTAKTLLGRAGLTREMVDDFVANAIMMDKDELELAKQDGKRPMIEHVFFTIIDQARKSGDTHKIDYFLDKLFGKAPTVVKVDSNNTNTNIDVQAEGDKELIARALQKTLDRKINGNNNPT